VEDVDSREPVRARVSANRATSAENSLVVNTRNTAPVAVFKSKEQSTRFKL